jgi:hypothetical protein
MKFISDTKWLSLITETYLEGLDAHNHPYCAMSSPPLPATSSPMLTQTPSSAPT